MSSYLGSVVLTLKAFGFFVFQSQRGGDYRSLGKVNEVAFLLGFNTLKVGTAHKIHGSAHYEDVFVVGERMGIELSNQGTHTPTFSCLLLTQ